LFIAATALAYDLTLITNNKKDFESIPNLKMDDWSV
jgi:predicted nucleic acid-binding protein